MRTISPVLGDIYDIDGRLREYDPNLSLRYDGDGKWTVMHQGRQGRSYPVLTIGVGTGNRWPKDDPAAPEITRPDMRVLHLIRAADLDKQGGADKAATDLELRDMVAREARKAKFAQETGDMAREMHPFFRREVDGAPDMRITFPAAKTKEAS